MTKQNIFKLTPLKGFLALLALTFAAAAFALVSIFASAEDGANIDPGSAMWLDQDVNEGHLEPGEQHWYKFVPDAEGRNIRIQKSLTMVFTPDNGHVIRYVTMKLFQPDQLPYFYYGDTSKMANFGAGQVVSRDNNPETGEYFWTGWVFGPETYYVQIANDSDFAIDYRLFNADVNNYMLGRPEPEAPAEAAPPPAIGADPGNPATLKTGLTKGTLEPNSTYWYSFQFDNFTTEESLKELDFTLFFTPDDGNRRHHVNFELFPASEFEIWRRGDTAELTNFGAGMITSRGNDYKVGARSWRGTVNYGDTYLMAIKNGTDVEIDYWLYDQDIYNPQLGPKPAPPPAPVFAQGAAPQTALPLKLGRNKGGLEPGQEAWYSFRITDFDNEAFEEMALTMITTPDDGNRIRQMTFDVFTADGVRLWSPGDNSQIHNIGAGSVVYRDNHPLTGERFWQGWVVDNDLYYVQIRNGTDVHMDYWLFTGDVYRPPLDDKPIVTTPKKYSPGTAPSAPLDLEVGINKGQLAPHQERWYAFSRGDVDQSGRVETVFTMVFTPDDGNRVRDVNFELFEANQLRDWAPDNRFNLVNFGRGSVVSRDGGLETGELLWKGHVLAHDVYYMRVSNESDVTIDYWIYPEDVIHANLNP